MLDNDHTVWLYHLHPLDNSLLKLHFLGSPLPTPLQQPVSSQVLGIECYKSLRAPSYVQP